MSSILKALRRLEEERARKSPIAPEIAASLLRRGARRRQLPLWVWPTVITVIALTAGLLFWSLRPASIKIESASQLPGPAPQPAKISRRSASEVIIEEVLDQRRPVLLAPPSPAVPAPLPATLPLARPRPEAVVEEKALPVQMKPVVPAIEERQSPVVSAIAWQEESSARMAVVDGLPVMTGEMVGPAKVAEIQPDRILFLEEGVLFSVRIYLQ